MKSKAIKEIKDFLLCYAFDLGRIIACLLLILSVIIFTKLISRDGYSLISHRRAVKSSLSWDFYCVQEDYWWYFVSIVVHVWVHDNYSTILWTVDSYEANAAFLDIHSWASWVPPSVMREILTPFRCWARSDLAWVGCVAFTVRGRRLCRLCFWGGLWGSLIIPTWLL